MLRLLIRVGFGCLLMIFHLFLSLTTVAAAEVNSTNSPFYVDGIGWTADEQINKSINVGYGVDYSAVLSTGPVPGDADFAAFTCVEFYNGVWVKCFDLINYPIYNWDYYNGFYFFPVSWSSLTAGVTMIEFSLVFFANTNPYTILDHQSMRYNILYDGVPSLDIGVASYDGSSEYVALRFIDDAVGYCYYYTCSPLSGGVGSVPVVPGGGVVTTLGLLDWVSLLPVNNIFSANVKAFIAPFIDRFLTPLQFDVTPLFRLRDYMYFTGVVFSTLDPVLNMGLLATLFLLVFALAFMYLFLAVWNTFRRMMW